MSAPAANALALPVITMAPMPSSASKSSNAAPSASISASSSAFIRFGRFSVMTPTRPTVSTRTGASIMDAAEVGRRVRCGARSERAVAQHVTQLELLELSGRRGRHRVADDQALRDVLQRDLLHLEELDHPGEVDALPRLGHDHRAGTLAESLVGVGN